jgi:hypothetical protein
MTNPSKRFGVIVGISNYSQVATNNNLRFTVNDAERLYQALHTKGGFADENLKLLVDVPSDEYKGSALMPTRSNILSAVNQFAAAATENDVLLVFFAGHGVEVGSHPYLLSNDTKMDVVRDTAVDISILNSYLEKSKARCTLRIFDACRSGFSEARLLNPTMSRGLEQALLKSSKGWATFSACSTGECAFEHPDLKQGVFTYYLCEGLNGAAANEHGVVTWERLIDYVKISVANFCKSQSWQQTPHTVADLSGTLELVMVEGAGKSIPPPEPASPVQKHNSLHAELRALVDGHMAELAGSVRRFEATKKEQTTAIGELLHTAVLGQLLDFSHPCLALDIGDPVVFFGYGAPREKIEKCMEDANASDDFTREGQWIRIRFQSSELSLPSSQLWIAVARFKFFYWIWFQHSCIPNQRSVGWVPDPEEQIGYFTFSPGAMLDVSTVGDVTQRILKNHFQSVIEWAVQSRKHCEEWVRNVHESDSHTP